MRKSSGRKGTSQPAGGDFTGGNTAMGPMPARAYFVFGDDEGRR